MEVLQIFGSWNQEINLWLTNHESPTLLMWKTNYLTNKKGAISKLVYQLLASDTLQDDTSDQRVTSYNPKTREPFSVHFHASSSMRYLFVTPAYYQLSNSRILLTTLDIASLLLVLTFESFLQFLIFPHHQWMGEWV